MQLKGSVSNVTNFGAFVDVGVHQDGLVHISELSQNYVEDPRAHIQVGDVVDVWVLQVDLKQRRLSLSCKNPGAPKGKEKAASKGRSRAQKASFSLQDLMAKFNKTP